MYMYGLDGVALRSPPDIGYTINQSILAGWDFGELHAHTDGCFGALGRQCKEYGAYYLVAKIRSSWRVSGRTSMIHGTHPLLGTL